MIKDDFSINFSGFTHDHSIIHSRLGNSNEQQQQRRRREEDKESNCSTIAILRRHPMYDCLVLVKKFRNCIGGYSLEFPTDKEEAELEGVANEEPALADENILHRASGCGGRKLVSRFLDGDDPMLQPGGIVNNGFEPNNSADLGSASDSIVANSSYPFAVQRDDKGDQCSLVNVPINGLLDRLKGYTETGVAVDSRVYAFAMGLKTAERIMATNSMKELQETPI